MPFFPEDCISRTPPPSGSYGVYVYPMGGGSPINVSLDLKGGMIGAFGSLLTSKERPVVHLSFPYGVNSDVVDASGSFGASVTASSGKIQLSTGTGSNGYATMESIGAIRYIAGQGSRVKFAGFFTTGSDQSTQEVGTGDDLDGYFFGYSGSLFGVCRRRAGIDDWTLQTDWNGDRMDGSGSSGMTLNPSLGNVYMISYQWLGFGAIKFFITRPESGEFHNVHTIVYSNANTIPSVNNPTLPLRAAVRNWGNTTNLSVSLSSMGGFNEGSDERDHPSARYSTNRSKGSVSTEQVLFSLQNRTTYFGQRNRTRAHLDLVSISNRSNSPTSHRLVLNPTVGGVPSYVPLSQNSVISIDDQGTTLTGGKELLSFEIAGSSDTILALSVFEMRIRPGDVLVLTASGSNSTIAGSLAWNEEF